MEESYTGEDAEISEKSGLTLQALQKASPTNVGTVLKLHVPFAYTMLPEFLQNRVSPDGYISYLVAPQWKERELIICGSYLYRFQNCDSSEPKGAPIRLKGVTAKTVEKGDYDDIFEYGLDAVIENLPPGIDTIFTVSSFGKQQYFATSSYEDAVTWVNSLRESRQETITRSMGHSKVPEPQTWKYFDNLAEELIKKKERMKLRMRQMESQQLEAGVGGTMKPFC